MLIITAIQSISKNVDENKINDYNNLIKQVIESRVIANNNWLEQDKLVASDGATHDCFGWYVCINKDSAIIGAPFDDDFGYQSGSAYVFILNDSTWTQQAKLIASDSSIGGMFGYSVAIKNDTAIIGSPGDNLNTGSVYVFTRTENTWTQQEKISALDSEYNDYFGHSVSIDNDYLIIGAWGDNNYGPQSGSAYVFIRNDSTWAQQAKLIPSDSNVSDMFGYSVSISDDTALIGAPDDGFEGDSGSAYVFIRNNSTWTQQAKLIASDGATRDSFGSSVSLDGNTALIGAKWDDDKGAQSGSAYIFNRIGTTWKQQAKLLASDGATGDIFGWSVSLYCEIAVIGAQDNDENGLDSGSAYVFTRKDINWLQQQKLLASDSESGDFFGDSVAINSNTILVGTYGDNDNGDNSGSAYIFIKENQPPNPPIIDGPIKGFPIIPYLFTFSSIDFDGDDVSYYIDWGDGITTNWTSYRSSGSPGYSERHSWIGFDKFIIRAKAKDIYGFESPWTNYSFSTPRNRASISSLFLRFCEQFPFLERLFQILSYISF